jgi:hypothetical protein
MIALILAAALAGPTPIRDAVAALAQEFPNCAPGAGDSERIRCLEAGLVEVKRVADDTASCIRTSFVGAGADLVSTAAALKWCDGCAEANPAGFSVEARVGLKVALLGAEIAQCYAAAKHSTKRANIAKWTMRAINYAAAVSNTIAAIRGKPLLNWGITSAVAP